MRKLIAFIVFSTVTCMIAAASVLWEHGRKFVRDFSFVGQSIRKRYNDV